MNPSRLACVLLVGTLAVAAVLAQEKPLAQPDDYAAAMKKVAARFQGRPGVVLHVGDSITHSNPYGQWARQGEGQTDDDRAILEWMHAGANDDTDGWWLARTDLPGGRSYTATGGLRADELLAGGKHGLPALAKLLETYRPQMVVLMIGTNDVWASRTLNSYRADLANAVDLILDQGVICILSTIPPHYRQPNLARSYNDAVREIAKARHLPLIDYEREIFERRPKDWNGTLLGKDDVHPTAGSGDLTAASAPTAENLRNSGYLLRGWLTVQKVAEVHRRVLGGFARKAPAETRPAETKPAQGTPVRLAVTRDTWFSNVGPEADANLGGASRLKLKSHQEMSLIDVDPAALKGKVVYGATLHLKQSGPERLWRVTVSSFGSDWVEGTSTGYEPQKGSSSHNHRRHPDVPWAGPGSDLCAVMLGEGGTLWRMADATAPDSSGWQTVAVDPKVVAARVAGISYGFLLFDDTGTEWTRQGEKWTSRHFPNRFVHSRESGAENAPYLTVLVGPADSDPPAAAGELKAETGTLPAGEAWVSWLTPADKGPAGTAGFFVTVDGKEVPRYLIPLAGQPGERVRMHLRDLDLQVGAKVKLAVKAVDGAGNVGPAAELAVTISDREAKPLPGKAGKPFTETAPLPRLGEAEVAVLDELDKVQPVTGDMIPKQPDGYLAANHLWSAKGKEIHIQAARNEFAAFQVLLRGTARGVRPELTFAGASPGKASFFRYLHVNSAKGPLPDPVVPLAGGLDVPAADENIAGQKSGSLLCEVYVLHDAPAGDHKGKLVLRTGGDSLELAVVLRVWDFTLPDHLSFLPEMNCYGLPANERGYYRLAHLHRTVLNRVPYYHNGEIADGFAPRRDGGRFDWTAWDRRFGPYLDGSAFADLPRKGVPLDCFYLPLMENWPTPIEPSYNGDYWADRAFTPGYREAFVAASRQFAEHMNSRGWNDTFFQFFLNGKNDFKARGWSRSTAPWLLDEPSNFQDFWALRWFGTAFHEGVNLGRGKAKMVFRADISRPQWQRNALDGLLDYNVVGGVVRKYPRLVLDRKEQNGEVVVDYGGSNAIDQSNLQPVGWSLDSWATGLDGVLPWQTVGEEEAWKRANTETLFYPARGPFGPDPLPSIRLKAYRRGQQDVEYLTLLAQTLNEPRWAVGQRVREALGLRGKHESAGGDDAGAIQFRKLLPQDVWSLRVRLGQALSDAHPAARAKLVELRTPARDLSRLVPGYVSNAAPGPPRDDTPPVTKIEPGGGTKVEPPAGKSVSRGLQGPTVVYDALIDFGEPDRKFGKEPRSNALRRADECNAFLVRFDLDKLDVPAKAKLVKAVLSFYVWDPSSKGDTKVVALPLKMAWDEETVTWNQPAAGKKWQGGKHFAFSSDTGPASKHVVVKPDMGSDTVDPPLEYQLDVTEMVRGWLDGTLTNHGLAIAPVIDRAIDEGQFTRFQMYASEYREIKYTPKLTVYLQP
jgi:lysophospholipase L1-like esterase